MKSSPKILFMLRLYSGFVDSIKKGVWDPSGTPAIFKLLEEVKHQNFDTDFYFYCPFEFEEEIGRDQTHMLLEGFPSPIHVLFTPRFFKYLPARVRDILTQIYQAIIALRLVWDRKIDLFYTDRGNIIGGAFVARLSRVKTVIRLLGMPAEVASLLTNNRPLSLVYRWAYRSKFTHIIGTHDGSSIIPFLSVGINKDTSFDVKINGVNFPPKVPSTKLSEPISIGFIGRLSREKGAEKLVEAVEMIPNDNFEVKIVGYGPDMSALRDQIESKNLGAKVKLLGRVSHADLQAEISDWDIYVSLNEFGQISNANLEAAMAGLCLIFLESGNVDEAKDLFSPDLITWIKPQRTIENLANNLSRLLDSPQVIQTYKEKTQKFSENLENWPARIKWEVELLKSIGAENA